MNLREKPTQWSSQIFLTTAGPSDRAGFMLPSSAGELKI